MVPRRLGMLPTQKAPASAGVDPAPDLESTVNSTPREHSPDAAVAPDDDDDDDDPFLVNFTHNDAHDPRCFPEMQSSPLHDQPSTEWECILGGVTAAVTACLPAIQRTAKHNGRKWWWNDACNEALGEMKAAMRLLRSGNPVLRNPAIGTETRQNPQTAAWWALQGSRAIQRQFRKILRQVRESATADRLGQLITSAQWNSWKAVSNLTEDGLRVANMRIAGLTGINGLVISHRPEMEDILFNQFFPTGVPDPPEPRTHGQHDMAAGPTVPEVSVAEIEDALRQLSTSGSAGADHFSGGLLKLCWQSQSFRTRLARLYTMCAQTAVFPAAWKHAVVTVIRKPGLNRDYNMAKNYRPISLLSIPGKVLDKVLLSRMVHLCHDRLQPARHGSLPMHDCMTAVSYILHHARTWRTQKRRVLIATIDVSGAFNQIRSAPLRATLTRLGAGPLATVMEAWLQNRTIALKFNGVTSDHHRPMPDGAPQGSPISPFLWMTYLDTFFATRTNDEFTVDAAYVDDLTVCVAGETDEECVERLAAWTTQLDAWTAQRHLDLDKPAAMRVATDSNDDEERHATIRLPTGEVTPADTIRILGVTLNHTLTGEDHIENRLNAATEVLWRMNRVVRQRRVKLSPASRKKLVETTVDPVLDYGSALMLPVMTGRGTDLIDTLRTLDHSKARFVFDLRPVGIGKDVGRIPLRHELGWLSTIGRWRLQRVKMAIRAEHRRQTSQLGSNGCLQRQPPQRRTFM